MYKKLVVFVVAALIAALATPAIAQTSVIQSVENVRNKVATYKATANVTVAAAATDVFILTGSATRTVYVKDILISCTATTAGRSNITLVKRSTATTGGTSAASTAVSADSTNSTATADVRAYTANPTIGTGVSMASAHVDAPVSGATVSVPPTVFKWGDQIDQYIVLRGVAQQLAINFNTVTPAGGVCAFSVTWLER